MSVPRAAPAGKHLYEATNSRNPSRLIVIKDMKPTNQIIRAEKVDIDSRGYCIARKFQPLDSWGHDLEGQRQHQSRGRSGLTLLQDLHPIPLNPASTMTSQSCPSTRNCWQDFGPPHRILLLRSVQQASERPKQISQH